jgi:hypothetical protein
MPVNERRCDRRRQATLKIDRNRLELSNGTLLKQCHGRFLNHSLFDKILRNEVYRTGAMAVSGK